MTTLIDEHIYITVISEISVVPGVKNTPPCLNYTYAKLFQNLSFYTHLLCQKRLFNLIP